MPAPSPWGSALPEDALRQALADGVAQGAAPAVVLALWHQGREALCLAAGEAGADTVFDLASLTKPLATAALCAELAAEGALSWEADLGELWGPAVPRDKSAITVAQLMTHAAGFPAHRPYFEVLERHPAPARRGLLKAMLLNEPLQAPPGSGALYSDLGYMLLGLVCEDMSQLRLHRAVERMYERHGVNGPCFAPIDQPLPWPREMIAPSGPLPGRPTIRGQAEDENAHALGGVAGHAGLFGTAGQTGRVMAALCASALGQGPWPTETARMLLAQDVNTPGSSRTPGFDTPQGPTSLAGDNAPAGTVGHLGFTGTSLWWHPASNSGAVLLTNRVALGRDNRKIAALRRQVHALAWRGLGLEESR